jgi:cysteine desulfurase / selenocysteine lyase
MAAIEARCRHLSGRLREGLRAIGGLTIRDLGRNPSAIVSFTIEGLDAPAVVAAAGEAGITIGASNPSSTRIDAEARGLPPLVRASPNYYNTEEEVDRLVDLCAGLARSA